MFPSRQLFAALLCAATGLSPAMSQPAVQTTTVSTIQYGAHPAADGWIDFAVYAPYATGVSLLLYAAPDAQTPSETVPMQQTGTDWSVRIRGPGIAPGMVYMFQVSGQGTATAAMPFGTVLNSQFVLNDPYAYQTQEVGYSTVYTATPFVDITAPDYAGGGKSIVYDHAADPAPTHVQIAPQDLVVYELHVQDYTAEIAGLAPGLAGTYLGLAQGGLKTPGGLTAGIDHLVELGVNAVELMPVTQYDKETASTADRVNHWGYMPTNYLAPEMRYASRPGQEVIELKQLINAFHARGIAVFMDVVYNHTAESSWLTGGRLADKCYNLCDDIPQIYRQSGNFFYDDTGTGNGVDFSGGARFTKTLVQDSLALWYGTYGVDGFRFDLARVLADGSNDAAAWVGADPRYAAAHLHAEPWDTTGTWLNFMDSPPWDSSNNRWAKWIGGFRDSARQFSNASLENPQSLKLMIEGRGIGPNPDGSASSKPWRSINFITVHDGYTLRDCVFYNDNGGSQNCWDSGGDENLRRMREKLLLGLLLTSNGVPLLQEGDEFGRSKSGAGQAGAGNSYDYESISGNVAINRVNWIDWSLKDGTTTNTPNAPAYGNELWAWTRGLIALRQRWTHFRRPDFAAYATAPRSAPGDPANDGDLSYAWEGPVAGAPTQLAAIWWGHANEPDLMVIYNEDWNVFSVSNLGTWSQRPWKILARSWLPAGQDLCTAPDWTTCPDAGPAVETAGRSMTILAAQRN